MKKIYLKDLKEDDLRKLLENNREFLDEYGQRVYEDNMESQLERGTLMFGRNEHEYIDIKDNYDSFYLRLKNWVKFIDNLDSDYLCNEGIELYNYIIDKKNKLYNMTMYNDNYNNLEEHIENKCNELLQICEKQLHEYEKYPSDDDVIDCIIYNEWYKEENFYTDENMKKIYLDFNYTKEYE